MKEIEASVSLLLAAHSQLGAGLAKRRWASASESLEHSVLIFTFRLLPLSSLPSKSLLPFWTSSSASFPPAPHRDLMPPFLRVLSPLPLSVP